MAVKDLLIDLVAVRSDTGTHHEVDMAAALYQHILDDPYFQAHPDFCGQWSGGDFLARPVVWALKRGSGRRTIVLTGHYDAVETSCYGDLEPWCLNPSELRPRLAGRPLADPILARDVSDPAWLFGRGAADMKAGLAVALTVLFDHKPDDVNVLFTAVSDEENLSAGARQAVSLYEALQSAFALDYVLAVLGEPNERDPEKDRLPLFSGSCGKILPLVVVKGTPTHGSKMLDGINSAHVISRVAAATEYDPAYIAADQGMLTEPPAIQLLRDLKSAYDVSLPEYSAAAFNVSLLAGTNPSAFLSHLMDTVRQVIAETGERRRSAHEAMPGREVRWLPDGTVLTMAELDLMLAGKSGCGEFRSEAEMRLRQRVDAGETLLMACTLFVRDLMTFPGLAAPAAVVAVAPPFYPSVSCGELEPDIRPPLARLIRDLEKRDVAAEIKPYSFAMTDMSYMSCAHPDGVRAILNNLAAPADVYDMDVAGMARLNIPTVMAGPAGRDIHQIGERVYLPDVTRNLPAIYRGLISMVAGR